jgi:phosphate transport system ATP-binding protein
VVGPDEGGISIFLRVLGGSHFTKSMQIQGSVISDPHVGAGVALATNDPLVMNESIRDSFSFRLRIAAAASGRPWNRSRSNEAIERALTRAALWHSVKDRLASPVSHLSVAQQRQLKIAHALSTNPDLILLDTDALCLDPISLSKVEDLFWSLKDYCTIVLATHNMQLAARISDYTAFLMLGHLVEFDTTNVVFTRPANKMTEDFVTGNFG